MCLPPAKREIRPGTECTVIGWGKREDKNGECDGCAIEILYGVPSVVGEELCVS